MLRGAGLRTVSVSPFAERHSAWWFYAGFQEMYNTGGGGMESAEEITPTVLDWIDRNGAQDNWFLHVNYWDPHTPYRAPVEFGDPFADDPLPAWLTEEVFAQHLQTVGPHHAREIAMYDNRTSPRYPRHLGELRNMADLRQFMDGYDCGIRYMDEHIGRVLNALADQGALEDLAIIVSSDHGENLGELGIYGEHATADAITPRIPMLIRWPGGRGGSGGYRPALPARSRPHPRRSARPAEAGALGWAELRAGHHPRRGLRPRRLVLSQCAHVCQRGVRFDDWMYLRTYHDGYHLFPEEMLFDVAADPHEQHDLAPARPEVCQQAASRLAQWHTEMMGSMPETVDPLWTVMKEGGPYHARGHLRAYCDYLERTDRGWAVPELKRRHPQEFA